MSRFYVTTPLYYVNDKPHIGHAYTTIAADVIARWHRLKGDDVHFLTGTDEHGQKVYEAAEKRGMTPKEHADDMVKPFQNLWEQFAITNDDFIRTTETRHTSVVQAVLAMLYERGDIYADNYEGWYSTSAERFWTEKDLIDGKCPDTGLPVHWLKERNYFFKMGKYADQLRQWITDHPDFLRPDSRRAEIEGYLRQDVGSLCISRPKTRLPWGIELPFDAEYVTYVWFDALLNYITAIGYHPDPAKSTMDRWPATYQIIGKDILATHGVYWSTMLFALGLPPTQCLYAHGWWTVEGTKMSKSLGNVVDPNLLIEAYGREPVRYFLLKQIPFGGDGNFAHDDFMGRFNADLANDYGNLGHRSLSMIAKWCGGVVPPLDAPTERDNELTALAQRTFIEYSEQLEALQFSVAFETLWGLVRAGNKYVDSEEPWKLNREGDTVRLGGVMRRALEICRIAAVLTSPVMPEKSAEMLNKLGLPAVRFAHLDSLDGLIDGATLTLGEPLFPRMQKLPDSILAARQAAEDAAPAKPAKKKKKKKKVIEPIDIADFAKVQLKVGHVLSAETHPDAERLLVLQVNIGEPKPRQIVAGIASLYTPESLVGKTVIVVANLKPAELRGVMSEGMLLAAGGREVIGLASIPEGATPGTTVR
ncbi:MAG: methionyl-tRNA synthetase [Myxococcota bacterium]